MTTTLLDSTGKPIPAAPTLPAPPVPAVPMTDSDRRLVAMQQFHDEYILMAKELPKITKDGKIAIGNGKPILFASFENIHDVVVPILLKYGFRISFHGEIINDQFWMRTVLRRGIYGEDSLWPVDRTPVSKAMNPSQATGSGSTYACRYGMVRLLNLNSHAPEDADTDAVLPPKTITGKQAQKLSDAIVDAGLSEAQFCEKYKIPAVDKLPVIQWTEATQAVAAYKKKKGAQQ